MLMSTSACRLRIIRCSCCLEYLEREERRLATGPHQGRVEISKIVVIEAG